MKGDYFEWFQFNHFRSLEPTAQLLRCTHEKKMKWIILNLARANYLDVIMMQKDPRIWCILRDRAREWDGWKTNRLWFFIMQPLSLRWSDKNLTLILYKTTFNGLARSLALNQANRTTLWRPKLLNNTVPGAESDSKHDYLCYLWLPIFWKSLQWKHMEWPVF